MKKLVIIAATAALMYGQAAMAGGISISGGHGGAVKWSVHWNGGHGHAGNRHSGRRNNGRRHHGGGRHAHRPAPRPRHPSVHCHSYRGHHGHLSKSCHAHGGRHNRHGGH